MHMGRSILTLIASEQQHAGPDTVIPNAREVKLILQLLGARSGALQQVKRVIATTHNAIFLREPAP